MSRSEFKARLDRDVAKGEITKGQRRQCLKAYDKRQPRNEDALDDVIEGIFGVILGALGVGRDD